MEHNEQYKSNKLGSHCIPQKEISQFLVSQYILFTGKKTFTHVVKEKEKRHKESNLQIMFNKKSSVGRTNSMSSHYYIECSSLVPLK